MANKNKSKKPEKGSLQAYPLELEADNYPKHYMTAEAGKQKPFYLRWSKAVSGFFSDIKIAIKAIIKDVM